MLSQHGHSPREVLALNATIRIDSMDLTSFKTSAEAAQKAEGVARSVDQREGLRALA
jgi:hypothetical protein